MYIREKLVKVLKIKNWIFLVVGVFFVMLSIFGATSLLSHYWGDWETVANARSTPESITLFFVGLFLYVVATVSQNLICNAYFYSSYFECSLDGSIDYSELVAITGKSASKIKAQLHILRIIYMKKYKLTTVDGVDKVELYSKKYVCECRTCGAPVEKSEYFAGTCHYCGSSDVFAKVLTGNRIYSISNQTTEDKKSSEFYLSKHIKAKEILLLCAFLFGLSVFFISLFACFDQISDYNNQEHLRDVLMSGKSYSSYDLIKRDILDTIYCFAMLLLAVTPLIISTGMRLKYIISAGNCALYFAHHSDAFVEANKIPIVSGRKLRIKSVKSALCHHYLKNCTFEKHDDKLKIALAKKIIKDECPSCGASIVGAVDENYKCKYCGCVIMGVISKK